MLFQESETLELKRQVVDEIKKEILAFANTNGGAIYVGIADDGTVLGLENVDFSMQQIMNMVRDSIKPDVTMFLHCQAEQAQGKSILRVDVQRGTDRPYYLARKGIRPEGIFVRQGTSSVPASDAAIRRMIKETDGDSYEQMRSLEQGLSFKTAAAVFQQNGLGFAPQQMRTLGILNSDGIYSNLGLLLSDQCPHTIKLATFQGVGQSTFKDRREVGGSLLKQLSDAYDYIDLHNQTHARFEKLLRIDARDYPLEAIRECLLNCIVHRDYSFAASTLISLYDDRLEFVSVGGLPRGITLADIELGISVCRNSNLANIFYRLRLIEAYGTGIKKTMAAYEHSPQKPSIHVSNNAFKIVLPNLNDTPELEPLSGLTQTEEKILRAAKRPDGVSRKELQELLGLSQSAVGRFLRELTGGGLLIPRGKAAKTRYFLPE
ncbi:RNA-binding domain-containing protein [Allofournierella sp.]|uniref:RNA-binding domain-containing protein n=1 Tax=Allofournierella sp. TaxID=1940256 RepID=UPI003AB1B7EA